MALTEGQRAYEAKRAAKAGMTLERWLAQKDRDKEKRAAEARAAAPAAKEKKKGFFSKLIERGHKPL